MMLIHNDYSFKIRFEDEFAYSLTVENNNAFAQILNDLYEQIIGCDGKFVLSEDNAPIKIEKKIDLLVQFVPFEPDKKGLTTKLYTVLRKKALSSTMYCETQKLTADVLRYIDMLTSELNISTEHLADMDVSSFFKAVDLRVGDSCATLPERIIDYFIASNELVGERLFVTVNLKSYLNNENLTDFIKSVVMHKIKLLMIENTYRTPVKNEKSIVIDNCFCEIY